MKQYIRLDESPKETQICVVDGSGAVLARGRESTQPPPYGAPRAGPIASPKSPRPPKARHFRKPSAPPSRRSPNAAPNRSVSESSSKTPRSHRMAASAPASASPTSRVEWLDAGGTRFQRNGPVPAEVARNLTRVAQRQPDLARRGATRRRRLDRTHLDAGLQGPPRRTGAHPPEALETFGLTARPTDQLSQTCIAGCAKLV